MQLWIHALPQFNMNLSKVHQLYKSHLTSHAATVKRGLIFNKHKTDANGQKIQDNFYWTHYTTAGSQQKSTPKEWLSLFWSEKWINNHINNSAKQQHVLTFTRCLTIRAFETCWARLSAGEKHKQAKKTLSQCAFSASAEPLSCEIVMIQNPGRMVSSPMSLFSLSFLQDVNSKLILSKYTLMRAIKIHTWNPADAWN